MFLKCLRAKCGVAASIKLIIQGGLSVCLCLPQGRTCAILFCLNFAFMLFFGAFSNYANINLIIQGELTACQCLLLFITLDETGN